MADQIFGQVDDISEGTVFNSRKGITEARLHRNNIQGIDASREQGASAIVLSGGYEDDEDYGNIIYNTGHGGQDENGNQVNNQDWTAIGNQGLVISSIQNKPVRVIRGDKLNSNYSPPTGYRYDGIYYVEEYFTEIGSDGFKMCKFKLVSCHTSIDG